MSLSAAKLAEALREQECAVGERTVNRLLHDLAYSLQSNRKTLEGRQRPDRDAQFSHINRCAKAFQSGGDPVVSVDTKYVDHHRQRVFWWLVVLTGSWCSD